MPDTRYSQHSQQQELEQKRGCIGQIFDKANEIELVSLERSDGGVLSVDSGAMGCRCPADCVREYSDRHLILVLYSSCLRLMLVSIKIQWSPGVWRARVAPHRQPSHTSAIEPVEVNSLLLLLLSFSYPSSPPGSSTRATSFGLFLLAAFLV